MNACSLKNLIGTMIAGLLLASFFLISSSAVAFAEEQDTPDSGAELVAGTSAELAAPDQGSDAADAATPPAPMPCKGNGVFYLGAARKPKLVVGMLDNARTNDVAAALVLRKDSNLAKFKLVRAGKAGVYFVQNVATGRQLSVAENDKGIYSVRLLAANKSTAQRWNVAVNPDKTISITSCKTKTNLGTKQNATAKNTRIILSKPSGSLTQKFKLKKTRANKKEIVTIDVPCMRQNPQLPTGCESVALTNALNYWGFGLSKTTVASRYMPYGGNGVYNFIGSPYNWSGWIICAPGIKIAADRFLRTQDTDVKSKVVHGEPLKNLRAYIDQGYPVVVWTTIGMGSPGGVSSWRSGYPLRSYNHAVVLSGYNPKTGAYLVSDSLAGRVWRSGGRFTWLYNAMGKQGVVLYN